MSSEEKIAINTEKNDKFSRIFFFSIPWTIPIIVTSLTFLFYPFAKEANLIWLPLLIIYWITIWGYTIIYNNRRGGVFTKERFKLTLKLKGKYVWLQYLLVYGPLTYAIPLFILNYGLNPRISVAMYLTLLAASIINGPSEEIFWRACMDEAGKKGGISQKGRLLFAPIAFAFWHTAFIVHLFPWDAFWWIAWAGVMLMTWSSGFIWMWVLHRSGRLVPQCIYHACANFLNIFPLILVSVLEFYF